MGAHKDHNYESIPFLSQNQECLWATNANWLEPKTPKPEHYTPYSNAFLFYQHFKAHGRWAQLKLHCKIVSWGWKDPRNTFTLPMWLGLFPRARVIHIHRQQKDVVKSLQQRNHKTGEVQDERLNDLGFCQNLHQQYIDAANSYQDLGNRYFELTYEDLIQAKAETISALEHFTGKKILKNLQETVHTK